jgi:RNA polymerase sigma factor (sigma-70 family)
MLKISIIEGNTERRLIVEGKLVGPWAAELRGESEKANMDLFGRRLVIDMRHVTAISQEGENVLFELVRKGVKFRCRGVFTKHVLKQVARRANGNAGKAGKWGSGWQSSSQIERPSQGKGNSMANTDAYVEAEGASEIQNREGTAQAFGHVLSSRLTSLHKKAYRMLGNTADAEDAVQDALLAAYTHLDQFKGQSQMSTWVTAIVDNCARLQMRKRRLHVHVPLDEPIAEFRTLLDSEQLADHRPNPEDECQHSELSTRLTHSYVRLSPTLRRTFQLRDIEGFSVRETARILRIPCGTVKAQSARARKKIKELMQRVLGPRSRRLHKEPSESKWQSGRGPE